MFPIVLTLALAAPADPGSEVLTIRAPSKKAIEQIEETLNGAPPGPGVDALRACLGPARARRAELTREAEALAGTTATGEADAQKYRARVALQNEAVAAFKRETDRLARVASLARDGDGAALRKEAREWLTNLNDDIDELTKKREREVRELRRVMERVPALNKALTDWQDMADDARHEARVKAVETFLSLVLLNAEIRVKDREGLTKQDLDDLGREYFGHLDPDPAVKKAYEKMLADLHVARSHVAQVEWLKQADSYRSLVGALAKDKKAEAALAVVHIVAGKDRRFELLLADAEILAAVGHAYATKRVGEGAVAELVELAEKELKTEAAYAKELVQHTNELRHLRAVKGELERLQGKE